LALPAGVHGIAGVQRLKPLARRSLRNAIGGPILALERIDAGGDIAVRKQQTKRRLRRIADIGVDPEQMRELRISQEISDAIVARPRHQTIAVPEKEVESHAGG
jgi:hypothetical protein